MAQFDPWRTFIAFELAPISAVLTAENVVRRIVSERPLRRRPRRRWHPAAAGGGDPAVSRRANPPGAGARADVAVAAGSVLALQFF